MKLLISYNLKFETRALECFFGNIFGAKPGFEMVNIDIFEELVQVVNYIEFYRKIFNYASDVFPKLVRIQFFQLTSKKTRKIILVAIFNRIKSEFFLFFLS